MKQVSVGWLHTPEARQQIDVEPFIEGTLGKLRPASYLPASSWGLGKVPPTITGTGNSMGPAEVRVDMGISWCPEWESNPHAPKGKGF